jgi:hypothetical protein
MKNSEWKSEEGTPQGGTRVPAGVNESESRDGIRNVQERDLNRAMSSAAAFVSSKPDAWCGSYQSKTLITGTSSKFR